MSSPLKWTVSLSDWCLADTDVRGVLSDLLIYSIRRNKRLGKYIQNVPGGKVNILGGRNIGHSKKNNRIRTCALLRTVSEIELFHCTVVRILRPILSSLACESVWSFSWPLWPLTLTLYECCEKCFTSSQKQNMLICWYTVHTRIAKCIDAGGEIFEKVLYWVNCTNVGTWTLNSSIINSTEYIFLINNFWAILSERVRNKTHIHIQIFA
jgi:hypothetical protein